MDAEIDDGSPQRAPTSLRFRGCAARRAFAADAWIRSIRTILKYPFQC
jgi:hypothetical protein